MITLTRLDTRFTGLMEIFYPLVFDKEISVLQMIGKLTDRVNKLTDFTVNLLEQANNYTDKQVNALRKELQEKYDKEIQEIVKLIDQTKELIIQIKGELEEDIANRYDELTGLIYRIQADTMMYADAGDDVVRYETEQKLKELKSLIDEINEDGFRIYNPTNGNKEHVQDVVNDIYDMLRFCLTAGKAEILEIPVEEIEKYTVDEVELYSAWIFDWSRRYLIISPATGKRITPQEAFNELYGYLQGDSRPVGEIEQRNYTCTDRNILEMTAYQMDYDNKRFT